ncbi:creatininase family protein [Bosea sp. RAF48]|uniref:creatininase family protein n=1 Tax=Bosea sp. RAF48 TaxID=3237480 RepID=UPI003F91AD89
MLSDLHWAARTAEDLNDLAQSDAIVLLPVSSTEQHGPHLPTGCDTILTEAVAGWVARLVAPHRPILIAPTVWIGLAQHHIAFGGSFSVSMATYHALLRDIVTSIKVAGFRKVLLVNGHGGNISALHVLTDVLTQETGLAVASTTYTLLPNQQRALEAILEDQLVLQHACEAETSMMMAVQPDLVRTERLGEAFQPGYRKGDASPLSDPLLLWTSFKDFCPSGVRGDARRASTEKGERILEVAAELLAAKLIAGEPWNRQGGSA